MVWSVIESFFREYGLVHHQIESYNDFVHSALPGIIEENRYIEVTEQGQTYKLEFSNVVFHRPVFKENTEEIKRVTPKECMDRNITYQSDVFVDVAFENSLGDTKVYKKVHIASIPVMVYSDLCNLQKYKHDRKKLAELEEDLYDTGGYFIIKGSPKVIASQERTAYNKVYVFFNKKTKPKLDIYAEIRSYSLSGAHSTLTQVGFIKSDISVVLPYIDLEPIPIGVVFRALGVESEEEMVKAMVPGGESELIDLVLPSLEHSWECDSADYALHYIGRRGKKFMSGAINTESTTETERAEAISYAKHLLSTELFPHLGTGEKSFPKKIFYLGYMVSRLIFAKTGRRKPEDRDHFANKRIATAGTLLAQQFYNSFRRLRTDITNTIERSIRNNSTIKVISLINSKIITTLLQGALSNNNWGGRGNNQGISQVYEKFNYAAGLSNMRKIVTPMSSEGGKIDAPRKLHSSHWGILCPAETPEGKKCGLIKNLALTALITTGSEPFALMEILETMNITPFSSSFTTSTTGVFVNGNPIGTTSTPQQIVAEIRNLRRGGGIDPETSISYDIQNKEISISTEAGRICRPLFIVENGELVLSKFNLGSSGSSEEPDWHTLVVNGIVELVDKAEEETLLLACTPKELEDMDPMRRMKITHCELHPSLMFGVGASIIPYPDHNQSPRNCYQASMGKQAIGVPGTNFRHIRKGKFHVLNYPQKPLASTKTAEIIGFNNLPAGQNAVVAICPWMGFGQEDSIIMNQDSIDRGFMNITTFMSFEGSIRRDKNEEFCVPCEERCNNFRGNISKLDPETGIVRKGAKVEKDDILIGKVTKAEEKAGMHRKPQTSVSVVYDHDWPGVVHSVQCGVNGEGYEYVRVVISQARVPVYGDKFSARHGQKGTVGMTYRSYDLPFTRDGIAPDILVNPLALPSRMTVGMLIEMLTGKKVAASSRVNSISVKKAFCLDDPEGQNVPDQSPGDSAASRYSEGDSAASRYSKFKSDGDATPFEEFSLRAICDELKALGFDEFGEERMTNGITGEPMKCMIFTGVCYYQRLRHMVIDKVHARSRGGRNMICRQPTEGRKYGGGLRCGHMERDCLLAQGASSFTQDRLMKQSDEYSMWVCKLCGLPAISISEGKDVPPRKECTLCQSNKVAMVKLPYATKLVMQEMMAMNVVPRLLT